MRGILANYGKPTCPAAAQPSPEVKRLLASCGMDVAGVQDKALLLVAIAGTLRRSELVGVDREHLRFTGEGITVLIPCSKCGQEGEGASIG